MTLPATLDLAAEEQRLGLEEKRLARRLAELEDRVRRFEDFERPAYESWIRVELGPQLAVLDELHQKIYERRLQAQKWVERQQGGGKTGPDPEVQARRQAKLEAKREARKQDRRAKQEAKREEKAAKSGSGVAPSATPTSRGLVALYRSLARRLHPDSPTQVQDLAPARLLSLWMETQSAYEAGDGDRLLAILSWLGEGGAMPPKLDYRERMLRIKAMRRPCEQLVRRITELRQDPAWEFEGLPNASRRKLRHAAAQELEGELERTQEVLEQLETFLRAFKKGKLKGRW